MPRSIRASQANYCYHVTNRGNARAQVFHKPDDYDAFIDIIDEARRRFPIRILAYCLMPNHFHLVLWPANDGDLSTWMARIMNLHVRRYQRHHHSTGHIWQGRFKAFPIEHDDHLRVVLRYVERNPLRAGLVDHAQDWPWSSLHQPPKGAAHARIDPGPAPRGHAWVDEVNRIDDDAQLARLRSRLVRGTPFGSRTWTDHAAESLGLRPATRPRGRPRKTLAPP